MTDTAKTIVTVVVFQSNRMMPRAVAGTAAETISWLERFTGEPWGDVTYHMSGYVATATSTINGQPETATMYTSILVDEQKVTEDEFDAILDRIYAMTPGSSAIYGIYHELTMWKARADEEFKDAQNMFSPFDIGDVVENTNGERGVIDDITENSGYVIHMVAIDGIDFPVPHMAHELTDVVCRHCSNVLGTYYTEAVDGFCGLCASNAGYKQDNGKWLKAE